MRHPIGTFGLLGLLAGLTLFVSGCMMVGPDYEQPKVKVATEWIEFEDPRLETTSPVEPEWWKQAFHDPTLDRLVDEALSGNLTLRSAGLRIVQARQQLNIVRGTQYPQEQFLGASAEVVDPAGPGGSSTSYSMNFNLSWEIDVWGRFKRQVESATALYDASLSNYDGVLVLLISEVAQTYLQVRTTEQRLNVARQNLVFQNESVRISQEKHAVGDISSLDVEQGRTLLYNTQATVALLDQSLRQLKIALAVLLGRLPQDLINQMGESRQIPVVSSDVAVGLPQDLIRRRPDIRTAERMLAAQSAQIGYATADLYPKFGLSGFIGPTVVTSNGQVFADLFDPENIAYGVGGLVRWDVLNYGRIESNIRLQDATFQQMLEDYRQVVLQAQAEVESSLVAFFQSQLQLDALQKAADAAQRAADVSMEQYQDGLVDFNTVVSTLRALISQQDQLASIQGTVAGNLVEVYSSLGGGWEIRQNATLGELLPIETQEEMKGRTSHWKKTKDSK